MSFLPSVSSSLRPGESVSVVKWETGGLTGTCDGDDFHDERHDDEFC